MRPSNGDGPGSNRLQLCSGIPVELWHWVSEVFEVQGHALACELGES